MSQSILTSELELKNQFEHMRRLSREKPLLNWEIRESLLDSLEVMLRENKQRFSEAISQDFNHRSQDETNLAELFPILRGISHARKHGRSWMKSRRVGISALFFPAQNEIQPQPLGVVGIIVPWNYPLFLSISPMIDALTAGNRVLLKMSESAPKFAEVFAEAIAEHISPDMVAVAIGEADIAQAFTKLPFDHLLFTGSTSTGKKVMQAAAPNLTPVTLELGGKSPVLVLDDADLDSVVNRVMMGKTMNSGQTCIAPDYVLLDKKSHHEFIQLAIKWVKNHYPKIANNKDYSHIINEQQFEHLQGLLATIPQSQIYPLTAVPANPETRLMPPVIVSDPDADSKLMQTEIFGPILPLMHIESLKTAVNFVNERPRPLALYVFGENEKNLRYVRQHTVSGGVCVNDVIFHVVQNELPFGGVGHSGIGAYHGKAGFMTFSHMKPVFVQSKYNGMNMLLPPYRNLIRKGIDLLSR